MIKRSAVPAAPGMLCKPHSHSAWVTNDLDQATAVFSGRYGVREFSYIKGPSPLGGYIKVAFAWAGGQILEVIQASGPGFEFYNEILPAEDFAIRFHHLGYVIEDDAGWKQLESEIAKGEWQVVSTNLTGDFIDAYYIDAPELGHYLEYVHPFAAGSQFYDAVPVS